MRAITIAFDTPTLNEKGEIIVQTHGHAEQFTEDLPNGISLEMVLIPRGIFKMGSLCTEIYGNGAQTTGWKIIHLSPETAALIKPKIAFIVSPAADRGMSHRLCTVAQ